MTDAKAIAAAYGGTARGNTAYVPTPGHSSRDRGTVVTVDPAAPDGVLVHSFNGGEPLAFKDDMRDRGLLPERKAKADLGPWKRVGAFDYSDPFGSTLYRTVRLEPTNWTGPGKRPKNFAAERYDNGKWIAGMADCERVPYRLPDLIEAVDAGKLVYLVEGERKADKLAGMGFAATAVAFGANGWRADYAVHLKSARVCVLPDNDDQGRGFARRAIADIVAGGGTAFVLELPELPAGGDIMDWQGNGAELHELTLEAATGPEPAWLGAEPAAPICEADPVDLWGAFDPPPLPLGLLPLVLEQWALANGDMMGCDPAGLAMAALVTCAAAIPDEVQLKVKRHDNWTESARIWAALVGDPSTKKSPILSAATGPICRLDAEKMRAWLQRVAAWEALPSDEKKVTPRPPQERLRIEDATIEAAQQVLEGSPWGVMLLQDELSGLFGAMDKYSGGKGAQADRAFWLRSFNGGEYALNRVSRGASLIPNLSVSMLGGIQPEPLRKIAGDAVDDGLLQRLFPIILRRATLGRDEAMPPVNTQYRDLIEALHTLKAPGGLGSGTLVFSDGAQAIRRDLEERHLSLQGLETINRKLAAHIGKYDGMFARLCVIWHCVENSGQVLPVTVTEETAGRVAEFLHRFLLAHAVAFYAGCLGLSEDHDRLTAIAGHILAHKLERVTNRDIARGDRTMRGLRDHEVRPLLEQLEALGWLERVEAPRPSSPPHFAVNPAVHTKFEAKGRAEAQRRKEARETIAGLVNQ